MTLEVTRVARGRIVIMKREGGKLGKLTAPERMKYAADIDSMIKELRESGATTLRREV